MKRDGADEIYLCWSRRAAWTFYRLITFLAKLVALCPTSCALNLPMHHTNGSRNASSVCRVAVIFRN